MRANTDDVDILLRVELAAVGSVLIKDVLVVDAPGPTVAEAAARWVSALLAPRRKADYARRLRPNLKPSPEERELPLLDALEPRRAAEEAA